MNERIKELARTAEREVQISLGERWTTVGRAEFMRLYNEKFAELIVQECAKICYDPDNEIYETRVPLLYEANKRIKEHFGVE